MNDMLISAQQLIGKHGREFAASAGQASCRAQCRCRHMQIST